MTPESLADVAVNEIVAETHGAGITVALLRGVIREKVATAVRAGMLVERRACALEVQRKGFLSDWPRDLDTIADAVQAVEARPEP